MPDKAVIFPHIPHISPRPHPILNCPIALLFILCLDDEEDVHYCGRCKLSFTNLSEYIKHKANKVCRDTNKSTLTEVVDKLPISLNKSPEKLKEQHSEGTDGTPAKKTKGNETISEGTSPATKRVEVQFLEPVVDAGSDSGATAEDESAGGSTEHGEKSSEYS